VAKAGDSVLAGRGILVTRAAAQSGELCRELEARGARAIAVPMLRFELPEETSALDAELRGLAHFGWWLLTSQNAVAFAVMRGAQIGVNLAEAARGVRVVAVGPATAEAAREAGIRVDRVAREQTGLKLADEFAGELRGEKVLLLRSNLADFRLPSKLREIGAQVSDVIAYRTLPPGREERRALSEICWKDVAAALFFSPSAARHFAEAVTLPILRGEARHVLFVAIGPVTLEAIRGLELERTAQARDASISAILGVLEESLSGAADPISTGAQRR
jgi:uroporphyrinogen III methyltransferase/synthase